MTRVTLISLLLLSGSWACKVPVFRYALERWESDDYRAVIFQTSDIPPLSRLSQHANLEQATVNLDALTEEQQWQYDGLDELPETPYLKLYYPHKAKVEEPFWEGPQVEDSLLRAIHSPSRDKIIAAILAGASTTWIFIESGDDALDDTTYTRLESLLSQAAESLTLPEGVLRAEDVTPDGDPIEMDDVLRTSIPLRIDFPIIRLNPKDRQEAVFAKMLTGFMRDVPEGEPIAVPVFGRGRALEGIPASMIDETTVQAACAYLCGECSCQVKDQNPGIDLLLDVDWETKLEGSFVMIERELPPLAGLGIEAPPHRAEEQPPASPNARSLPRSLALTAFGLLVAILIGTYLMTRRQFG